MAGGSTGVSELQLRMVTLICCDIKRTECVRRCARTWGREGDQKEVAGLPGDIGIDETRRRQRRTPTGDFGQPGGFQVELVEGKQRGGRGV
jgi:hypothetical protein